MDFKDYEKTKKLRSVGYEILKQIGKKILSGDFNLTTISFPIRIMLPLSMLQTIAVAKSYYPLFFNKAAELSDKLERFKLVITAALAGYHKASMFEKPLNPILGETYELAFEDGSIVIKLYLDIPRAKRASPADLSLPDARRWVQILRVFKLQYISRSKLPDDQEQREQTCGIQRQTENKIRIPGGADLQYLYGHNEARVSGNCIVRGRGE